MSKGKNMYVLSAGRNNVRRTLEYKVDNGMVFAWISCGMYVRNSLSCYCYEGD